MAAPAPLQVAVLEDNDLLRSSLVTLLSLGGYQVVAEAADGDSFLAQLGAAALHAVPQVALVDLILERDDGAPPEDGVVVLERLRREHPRVRALVLSGSREPWVMERCAQAGAVGFLPKLALPMAEVLAAVAHVAAGGERWESPEQERTG